QPLLDGLEHEVQLGVFALHLAVLGDTDQVGIHARLDLLLEELHHYSFASRRLATPAPPLFRHCLNAGDACRRLQNFETRNLETWLPCNLETRNLETFF